MQAGNFLLAGGLLVAFGVGMRRTTPRRVRGATPWSLGFGGVGLVGAGLFPGDPVSGYPPGTPDELVYTTPGVLHDGASMMFFFGLAVAGVAFAVWCLRGGRWGFAGYSLLSAAMFLILLFAASEGFMQAEAYVEYGGLLQRLSLGTGFLWTTAAAVLLLRAQNAPASEDSAASVGSTLP